MTDLEEAGSRTSSARIPFLFYDVVGRMVPGAYLIVGIGVCVAPFVHWDRLICFLLDIRAMQMSGAVAAAILGAVLLMFGFAAVFLGFVLGALSHLVVEKGLWYRRALSWEGLTSFLGLKDPETVKARFEAQFGASAAEDRNSLNRASFLCAFYIWRTSTVLGEWSGRGDADLLAAQSIVLVTMILIMIVGFETLFPGHRVYLCVYLVVLLAVACGSGRAFDYHRQRRVYDRFGVFLALTDPPKKTS